MATYPVYSIEDLSGYSGRPVASYNKAYTEQAVIQATLLFKIATCLNQFPDEGDDALLAAFAIKAMADYIVLNQPYAKALAGPFQSESLGSYSYSKMAATAANGQDTGVMWFDLAVKQLGQCGTNDDIPSGGGIEVFEFDGSFVAPVAAGNTVRLLSPEDQRYHDDFLVPHDPTISKN